jgi:hypothetical protein
MAHFADKEFERHLKYPALGTSAWFCSESLLGVVGKALGKARMLLGPGKGHSLFRRNAQALACLALGLSAHADNAPVIAVLFRDCDGTNSKPQTSCTEKADSMAEGFNNLFFPSGVPMIPRPKSEAWLLCAIANGYQHCDSLENAPGNDGSPNSLKSRLDQAIPEGFNLAWILERIEDGNVDIKRITMPSLTAFRHRFDDAVRLAHSASWPPAAPASVKRLVGSLCASV